MYQITPCLRDLTSFGREAFLVVHASRVRHSLSAYSNRNVQEGRIQHVITTKPAALQVYVSLLNGKACVSS
jgi:hypothetical protein